MERKMKDSGIEWIGEIPEGWEVAPVRSCFDEVRTKNTDGQEQNALQFKSGNIISKTNFNANTDDYVADTITNYTVVLPDTVMINGLNLNYDFKSLRVALVKEKGVITSAYHLRNVSQHCQNIVHGFNSPTGIGISCNVQKLLNEYDKWKPVDKDYMINSGENVDLLKTFSVAFQAFNEALIPVIRYLLNTKNVGKELLYLRKWGDSLQKQFHHDVHCYHIFDLKFQNGNDATHEDLDTGDVIINGTLIDWDMVYELSDSVIAMPIANTSTNNLPL